MPDPARGEAQDAWQLRRLAAWCVGASLACVADGVDADYFIAANSTTTLNGGALNLSCTDLIVAGTLNVDSGAILNARNVNILPGGVESLTDR